MIDNTSILTNLLTMNKHQWETDYNESKEWILSNLETVNVPEYVELEV